jgi:hypothetical protein
VSGSAWYKVNSPNVVHEVFDDEVVIINLDSGIYYAVSGIAAEIWTSIGEASADEIIGGLASRCGVAVPEVDALVRPFLDQLVGEGLIVPGERTGERGPRPDPAAVPSARVAVLETPVLHKYSDMRELLLLDPIHEVDDVGWPVRPDGVTAHRSKGPAPDRDADPI